MSSRIFIFFCLTKTIGSPSSVEPAGGMLMRYSFAIGRNTCCTRKRSAASRRWMTWVESVAWMLMCPSCQDGAAGSANRLRDRAVVGVPARVAVAQPADPARADAVCRLGGEHLGEQVRERVALGVVERLERRTESVGARVADALRRGAPGIGEAPRGGPGVGAATAARHEAALLQAVDQPDGAGL